MTLELLEARYLLTGETGGTEAVWNLPITDPFADQAVTYQQMAQRAAHRDYVEGEAVVAVEVPLGAAAAQHYLAFYDWAGLIGVPVQTQTLLVSQQTTVGVALVKIQFSNIGVFDALQFMEFGPGVRWSAPNFESNLADPRELIPNDTRFGEQYHHVLVNNVDAWDVALGSPSVIVGIADDGIDIDHADLNDAVWVNSNEIPGNGIDDDNNGYIDDVHGYDFIAQDNDVHPLPGDDHGTHVAGIVGAEINNGLGTAGTAGGATLMPLRWFGGQAWTAAVIGETFNYAVENGARIFNTSYNMDVWVGDPVVTAGYQHLLDSGVLHFSSAGNGAEPNPLRESFEQTILVASTDADDAKTVSSNWGQGIDLAAPGGGILSTTPNNSYGISTGTSMSSPNAAGVAALVWSANPTWNHYQVAAQVLGTADNVNIANPGWEDLIGAGRINSYRALTEVLPPPQIRAIHGLPTNGGVADRLSVSEFEVEFDQLMDPVGVNDVNNYSLVSAGDDGILGTLDDNSLGVSLEREYKIGSNTVQLKLDDGALAVGKYRLTLSADGLSNPFATTLDGDGDSIAGDNFVSEFTVQLPAPQPIGLGSLIYYQDISGQLSAATTEQLEFHLDPGQSLSVVVRGDNNLVPTVEVTEPDGAVLAHVVASGSTAFAQDIDIAKSGTYRITVGGDAGTEGSFELSVYLNGALEIETLGGPTNNVSADAQALGSSSFALGDAGHSRLAVVGGLPASAGVPAIAEDFETSALGSDWTTSSSAPEGRIQLDGSYGAASGSQALLMDVNASFQPNLNEAVWSVDLSSIVNPRLQFSQAEWLDEDHPMPPMFTGSINADGVAISDDGVQWHRLWTPINQDSGVWVQHTVDLAVAATNAGIELDQVFIKFQQFDTGALPDDGRGYDDVSILSPDLSEDWYSFSLQPSQSSTILVDRHEGSGPLAMEVYDSDENLIHTAVATTNGLLVELDAVVEEEEFFVRVVGEGVTYAVVVTRGVDFDVEENDSSATAQSLDSGGVLGYVAVDSQAAAEPDDVAAETVVDSQFAGVTLSNHFGGGSVYAVAAAYGAPTGTNVFGPGPQSATGWVANRDELRADFHQPTDYVSIEVGSDGASDRGFLRAYDQDGSLLQEVTSEIVSLGGAETLEISRSQADIAYVRAAGTSSRTPLDKLVFGSAGSDDYYRLQGVAGESIYVAAVLPAYGPLMFENGLATGVGSSLRMELRNPLGVLVAENEAVLHHTPTTSGPYELRIFAAANGGEYYLQIGDYLAAHGDFNLDSHWDCADVDALVEALATESNDLSYDMTGDGTLDRADLERWLEVAGSQELGTPYRVGDANLDGFVDGADFIQWNNHKFAVSQGWCQADFNADGVTDGADYIAWQTNSDLSGVQVGRDPGRVMDSAMQHSPVGGIALSTSVVATYPAVPFPELLKSDDPAARTQAESNRSRTQARDSGDRINRFASIDALFAQSPYSLSRS